MATVATLQPPIASLPVPAVPNFRVFRYGVFEDMDDDDENPVIVGGPAFWGLDGVPVDIQNAADVAVVISVIEHDNGVAEQYQELVNLRAGISLGASLGAPSPQARAARLTADISTVLNGVDLPIPVVLDDDHIGTQQLVLDGSDLITVGSKDKTMVFAGDGAEYQLTFRIRRLPHWAAPFAIAQPGHAAPGALTAHSRHPEHIDVFWIGPDGGVDGPVTILQLVAPGANPITCSDSLGTRSCRSRLLKQKARSRSMDASRLLGCRRSLPPMLILASFSCEDDTGRAAWTHAPDRSRRPTDPSGQIPAMAQRRN
jgi:hypothetical protein